LGRTQKKQIASILCTEQSKIELRIMDVQMQVGGSDRDLFAIAFATATVNGIPPGKFVLDQAKMRQHLYESFLRGKLQMFPTLRERRSATRVKVKDDIHVFCACRMPELPGVEMVECCRCKEWYHVPCIQVPQAALEDKKVVWFCDNCNNN
jgi:hypothetical protein